MPGNIRSRRRNPVARNLYQNRGGVHEKSKKAKRAASKQETRRKVSEWASRSSFICSRIFNLLPG